MRMLLAAGMIVLCSTVLVGAKTVPKKDLELNAADAAAVRALTRTLKATETHRKGRRFKIEILHSKKGWLVNYIFLPLGISDELMCRVREDGTVSTTRGF